jgi:hypothetical protein
MAAMAEGSAWPARLDIWDSQEDFEAFGPTPMPILTGLGVEVAEPVIGRIHNSIEGYGARTRNPRRANSG